MNSKMLALWGQGLSVPAIASSLGTTVQDVQTTLRAMGVALPR